MKVCLFSKYPPIEGGVSSKTYWLSKALGKRGVEIHIVTNALEVEETYRQIIDFENEDDLKKYQPENIFVHSLTQHSVPFHVPFSRTYLERLINLGNRIIQEYNCNLIDSHYLQPYGLAAFFTKLLIGKPCILRHAGSDISRLLPNEEFHDLYRTALNSADMIATSNATAELLKSHGVSHDRFWFKFFQFPGADPEQFNPEVKPLDLAQLGVPAHLLKRPILTYMGKYDPYKGFEALVKAASEIQDDFLLLFVTGGRILGRFKEYIQQFPSLENKYYFLRFLPPWKIPSLLRSSTCLFHLENDFPVKNHMSCQPVEAFASAVPVLMSYDIFQKYQKQVSLNIERDKNVLAVNPKNHSELKGALLKIINNPQKMKKIGEAGHWELFDKQRFGKAADNLFMLYQEVSKSQSGRNFFQAPKNIFRKILTGISKKQTASGRHFQTSLGSRPRHPCLR